LIGFTWSKIRRLGWKTDYF